MGVYSKGIRRVKSPRNILTPHVLGVLVRALHQLWTRTQNESLKQLVEAYITVQVRVFFV